MGKIYDEHGRVIEFNNGKGFSESYRYDDNGNEIFYSNSTGVAYEREYDDQNRPILCIKREGGSIVSHTVRRYDADDKLTYFKNYVTGMEYRNSDSIARLYNF